MLYYMIPVFLVLRYIPIPKLLIMYLLSELDTYFLVASHKVVKMTDERLPGNMKLVGSLRAHGCQSILSESINPKKDRNYKYF